MRSRLSIIPLLVALSMLVFPLQAATALEDEIATQVTAARAILDPWHAQNPEAAIRKLHIVYWTPAGREPSADYQVRLSRIMEHIRTFYAKEMKRLGFEARTINLDHDKAGALRIHLVKGVGPEADYGMQSGSKIRNECLPTLRASGIDPDRETIVLFCNLAKWDAKKLIFTHKSPYYAGGSHRQGTAWQLDSPELDTINLYKTKPMVRDGQYGRISLGKHNSIFIGGIAHELGHALSLPHNKARSDEAAASGTALMGSGNRTYGDEFRKEGKGSFLTLAHALRLASHPQFTNSVKGMNRPAVAEFTDLTISQKDQSFQFSGKVSGSLPVYAVIAYCDPDGGGDYNATTATAIPDNDGKFSLHCRDLAPGKAAQLRLLACHVTGATSRGSSASYAYSVAKDGTPDIGSIQQRFSFSPLIAALNNRDAGMINEALASILKSDASEETKRIAQRLVASQTPRPGLPSPAAVKEDKTVLLTDTKPSTTSLGWGRPAYDHLPEPSLLLASGDQIFATGIYAHAPARHIYDVRGKWEALTGSCGLANGHNGSVVFVIKGDGKELWRSQTTKTGQIRNYTVALTDITTLELITEDGGDGTGADWGLWLDPTLTR